MNERGPRQRPSILLWTVLTAAGAFGLFFQRELWQKVTAGVGLVFVVVLIVLWWKGR